MGIITGTKKAAGFQPGGLKLIGLPNNRIAGLRNTQHRVRMYHAGIGEAVSLLQFPHSDSEAVGNTE
jgi:hypothetical protein